MVRKIKAEKGITLIEIIVVIAIASIFFAVAIPYYTKWKIRMSVEGDTKKIYGLLQNYRMKAFSEKKEFYIKVQNNLLEVYDKKTDTVVYKLQLENPFRLKGNTEKISIDMRGTFSGSSIYAQNYKEADAQYDCIAIDDIRVRLGKYNESEDRCVAK